MAERLVMRILHLSDLHAGGKNTWWTSRKKREYNEKENSNPPPPHRLLADALLQDHRLYPEGFDVIAVTGDITETASEYEFKLAETFLKGLQSALPCTRLTQDRPYLRVIPGNHDMNWKELEDSRSADERWSTELDDRKMRRRHTVGFAAFHKFLGDLGLEGRKDKKNKTSPETLYDFLRYPDPSVSGQPRRTTAASEREWCVLGLNSAVPCSPRDDDQYGWIDNEQMLRIESECLTGFSPWEFRLALVHHNPLVAPYFGDVDLRSIPRAKETVRDLLKKGGVSADDEHTYQNATLPCDALLDAGNYLHDSKRVLMFLEASGVQLVLSGHRHFGEPQHYAFPMQEGAGKDTYANPYGHGGVSVLATGSFGIPTEDAPSPSFQVVEVYWGNFCFNVIVMPWEVSLGTRPSITPLPPMVAPSSSPTTRLAHIRNYRFSCHSERPARVLDGLARLLSPEPKPAPESPKTETARAKGTVPERQPTEILNSDLHCGAFLDDKPEAFKLIRPNENNPDFDISDSIARIFSSLPLPLRQDVNATMWHRLCTEVLKNSGMYADLPHWSLTGIESDEQSDARYVCHFDVSYYLHYQLLNLGLRDLILPTDRPGVLCSFRAKHLLGDTFRPPLVCDLQDINRYIAEHKYLGLRTTMQVLFLVPDFYKRAPSGAVLLKVRSNRVGHFKGKIQLPVGGGFKNALFVNLGKSPNLSWAVQDETVLETGVTREPDRCIALTVNTMTFCPAFTFFLEMDRSTFEGFFTEERKQRTLVDDTKHTMYLPKGWTPKRNRNGGLPRDWWEGQLLIPVPVTVDPDLPPANTYADVFKAIRNWFMNNRLRSRRDEYVGSCVDLYCGQEQRSPAQP